VLADAIDETEQARVKAALEDASAARDQLVDVFHREAFQAGVTLFDPSPEREYGSLSQLRVVVRDGLAEVDGLADVLSLDGGELVPLASRLRAGFQAVAETLRSA
jgi:hypothetical protein